MGRTYSSSKVHVVGKGSREGSLKPADSMNHYGTPPIFTDELKNLKIKLGDTITLGCQGEVDHAFLYIHSTQAIYLYIIFEKHQVIIVMRIEKCVYKTHVCVCVCVLFFKFL